MVQAVCGQLGRESEAMTVLPHSRSGQYTSGLAGAEMVRSGAMDSQRERVVRGVLAHPGLTAGELARHVGLDRVQTARRLRDAAMLGGVVNGENRRCEVAGRLCMTWWPREGQGALL